MPYARRNWTAAEVERALANPRSSETGPAAHSRLHGVSGELYNHPLFQKARVITDVNTHSTLPAPLMAGGVARAFCKEQVQPYLARLDRNTDMKIKVNFIRPLGLGHVHKSGQPTRSVEMRALFIYCKPNPGNRDIPIFQTVIPMEKHYPLGAGQEPVFLI
ncbi:MAG TPA: hypothetical protein VNM14_00330 [Planctomycetota bacterium]|jgi:hypothetical protein|nr:hypothetical protein [Planctomycetota bacterium]